MAGGVICFGCVVLFTNMFCKGETLTQQIKYQNGVCETVEDELVLPWMEALELYKANRLVAVPKKGEAQASNAGNVRKDFFQRAAQAYPLKEVSFMMYRRGLCEALMNFYEDLRRGNKLCYNIQLDGNTSLVRLKD